MVCILVYDTAIHVAPVADMRDTRALLENGLKAAGGILVIRKVCHSNLRVVGDNDNSFCISRMKGEFMVSTTQRMKPLVAAELARHGGDATICMWGASGGRHKYFLVTSMSYSEQASLVKAAVSRAAVEASAADAAQPRPSQPRPRAIPRGKRPVAAPLTRGRKRQALMAEDECAAMAPAPAQEAVNDGDCPLVCPVDLDGHMREPLTLPCGCNFEEGAIIAWFREKSTCPTCRKKMTRGFDASALGVNKLIQQNAASFCKCKQD